MAEVQIPPVELVDVASLNTDGQNPNRMSEKQHRTLRESILRYGFIVPIITNKDLLIADGEQRWQEAKAIGMKQVQVIKLPVEDVDRRLLRQVLNKLKGEHEPKADAEEFQRIIDSGHEEDLKRLLLLSDQSLDRTLKRLQDEDGGMAFRESWEVVVECESEKQQARAKDPYYVQHFLGHKKLTSTEIYINIEHTLFEAGANDEFTVKVAEKPEEIKALLELGFEYILQKDNLIFLRKRR